MADTIARFVSAVLLTMAALLPIINSPGLAPIFLSMTPGATDAARAALAGRIARNSFMLLIGAMLVGSYVLIFFGLSLAVVKIAGGLLVTSTAWHLFRAEQSEGPALVSPSTPPPHRIESVSFYPLTFPLTVGPGSISVAVTVGAGASIRSVADLTPALGSVVGILLVSVIIYLCYRYAARLLGALGSTGTIVLLRLSAFLLLSVGVQIFTTGLIERFGLAVPGI